MIQLTQTPIVLSVTARDGSTDNATFGQPKPRQLAAYIERRLNATLRKNLNSKLNSSNVDRNGYYMRRVTYTASQICLARCRSDSANGQIVSTVEFFSVLKLSGVGLGIIRVI